MCISVCFDAGELVIMSINHESAPPQISTPEKKDSVTIPKSTIKKIGAGVVATFLITTGVIIGSNMSKDRGPDTYTTSEMVEPSRPETEKSPENIVGDTIRTQAASLANEIINTTETLRGGESDFSDEYGYMRPSKPSPLNDADASDAASIGVYNKNNGLKLLISSSAEKEGAHYSTRVWLPIPSSDSGANIYLAAIQKEQQVSKKAAQGLVAIATNNKDGELLFEHSFTTKNEEKGGLVVTQGIDGGVHAQTTKDGEVVAVSTIESNKEANKVAEAILKSFSASK